VLGDDITLLNKFSSHHELELSIHLFPFTGIWNLPSRDLVDVAASGISLTPERMSSNSYWSRPYSRVRRSALIRNEDSLRGYEDIRRISVVGESMAHSHALKHLPRTSSIQVITSIEQGVESLLMGKTDAVGTGSVSAYHQAIGDERLKVVDLHREDDAPELISFSVRREPLLMDAINQFISIFLHG